MRRRGRSTASRYAAENVIRLAILIVVIVIGAILTARFASPAQGAPPATTTTTTTTTKPSPVLVTGTRLTFDPKTATEGSGGFSWGLGSVFVTLRGHGEGRCEFDYKWEVEGAGNYQVYRVSVPLSSGPVVIDATEHDRRDDHGWSGGVFTSFTKEQATLIRSATRGWSVDPLAGTKDSVTHRLLRPGDGDKPLSNGDADGGAVTVRFLVHLPRPDGEFGNLAGEPWQRQGATVPLTGETEWKWAQHLLREMTLYEIRQVRLPARIGGPAARWLPGYDEIWVEMQPVAIERK